MRNAFYAFFFYPASKMSFPVALRYCLDFCTSKAGIATAFTRRIGYTASVMVKQIIPFTVRFTFHHPSKITAGHVIVRATPWRNTAAAGTSDSTSAATAIGLIRHLAISPAARIRGARAAAIAIASALSQLIAT